MGNVVAIIVYNSPITKKMSKERKEALEALEALFSVMEDIEMLRIGTWKPDDDSCDTTIDNLKLVIKYIEKTKGV